MPRRDDALSGEPLSPEEAEALLAPLADHRRVLLAISGGPDSTALLVLAAAWARGRNMPSLEAATVDHGLRPEAGEEARAVAALAAWLGVPHRVLRGPAIRRTTGLQEAARALRYDLLITAAAESGAGAIVTAHTLDDQAETVLMRLAAGSGLAGLGGIPAEGRIADLVLLRPFLDVPKARLVATCLAHGLGGYVRDPSNLDPRFGRGRLRAAAAVLAREGLTASRLARLAARVRRADAALEAATDAAFRDLVATDGRGGFVIEARALAALPDEIALRLVGRMVAAAGEGGAVPLAGLERLVAALRPAIETGATIGRTLAGAKVSLERGRVRVRRAPPRRGASSGAGART